MEAPPIADARVPAPPCRRRTREVAVGAVVIGGRQPIRIQSMTTARTDDIDATVRQTIELFEAGCEIVRIAAPTVRDAAALRHIRSALRRKGVPVPLVADVHYLPAAAMEAALHADKVRINPGNYAGRRRFRPRNDPDVEYEEERERAALSFRPLVERLRDRGVALRIGANHGSLSDRILHRYGDSPLGMVESALEFVRVCRDLDYHAVVVSMKASRPGIMIEAYRLLAARMDAESMDYPLHLGVTEAGAGREGRIKSAVGIGALLEEGLGDTVRVSLTEDPVREIPAARALVELCARDPLRESVPDMARPVRVFPSGQGTGRRRSRGVMIGPVPVGGTAPPAVETVISPAAHPDADEAAALIRNLAEDPRTPVELVTLDLGSRADLAWAERMRASLGGSRIGLIVSLPGRHLGPDVPATDAIEAGIETAADMAAADRDLAGRWIGLKVENATDAYDRAIEIARRHPAAAGLSVAGRATILTAAVRAVAAALEEAGAGDLPLRLAVTTAASGHRGATDAAARLGSLLCDGLGDAVRCDTADPAAERVALCYRILQAAGARITRAEFISCPSCGRTLFDIETTSERIRALTGHLTGLRIAVMGCIVNGPGEMADAHFGYVGAASGRINLYAGRECVERNIPEAEAPGRLVALIRERGLWRDPPVV